MEIKLKKELFCGRCGKPAQQGKKAGDQCLTYLDGKSGAFCVGTIREYIDNSEDFLGRPVEKHLHVYTGDSLHVVGTKKKNETEFEGLLIPVTLNDQFKGYVTGDELERIVKQLGYIITSIY